jgi:hypothetical protein
MIEAISLSLSDNPPDGLAMTGHADAFSAACVVQNVGKVAANMGDRQRQALHAPKLSKKNACS